MGVKLNQFEVRTMCKDLMKKLWDEEFDLPIELSGRMSRTFGYFQYGRRKIMFGEKAGTYELIANLLKFSKELVGGAYNIETIESVIKHELCHYHMFMTGSNWHDGDYLFEKELIKIGASSTRTLKGAGEKHKSVCGKCGKITGTGKESTVKRRVNSGRYRSRCCGALIVYGGMEYLEDNNKVAAVASTLAKKISDQTNVKVAIEIAAQVIPEEIVTTPKVNTLDIDKIVKPGVRGMTGEILFPVMKELIDKKEEEKIKLIYKKYEKCCNQIRKYWNKKRLVYLEGLGL
jgi:SprT-like protein